MDQIVNGRSGSGTHTCRYPVYSCWLLVNAQKPQSAGSNAFGPYFEVRRQSPTLAGETFWFTFLLIGATLRVSQKYINFWTRVQKFGGGIGPGKGSGCLSRHLGGRAVGSQDLGEQRKITTQFGLPDRK